MEAIILAGGKGTRLRTAVPDLPKPMAPIAGEPFLKYLLKYSERDGVTRFVLSVGYKSEAIVRVFGDDFNGIPIAYAVENTPMGTGGAIRLALAQCAEKEVFVLNGDTYFDADLRELARLHASRDADVSVALKEMVNFDRYGAIDTDDEGRITAFREKAYTVRGYINGGVYRIGRDIFDGFDLPESFSFEAFLTRNLNTLRSYGLPSSGNFIDIGVPEDYAAAGTLLPEWAPL
jgi:D-glycero-alpha-D-manno-heptose 1-phosphate guanylyltransferase